jgi:hypothetical protein
MRYILVVLCGCGLIKYVALPLSTIGGAGGVLVLLPAGFLIASAIA